VRATLLVVIAACHASSHDDGPRAESATVAVAPAPSASASADASPTDARALVAKRPYRLVAEDGDGGARPLVVLLHGYGSSGAGHDAYFGLSAIAKRRGVMLAIPDGTRDHGGKLFWNATEACCDFDRIPIDDVAYLDAVVADVERREHVDPARIYVIGHSNGAFMAHAWACEKHSPLAAIVALAGVPWTDRARCKNRDVSVLQIHGDADRVIAYAGGRSFGNGVPYPSAEEAVSAWAERDGCSAGRHAEGSLDLDRAVPGAETSRAAYACSNGLAVELWTMSGSGHVPQVGPSFAEHALDFLLAHPRKIHSNE